MSGKILDAAELGPFPALDRLERILQEKRAASGGNLWGASQALVLAALVRRSENAWLVTASTDAEARLFADDLLAFGVAAELLPSREDAPDAESLRQRLRVTQQLTGPAEHRPRVIVASVLALLQPVPSPQDLERDLLSLCVNQELDAEGLVERLVAADAKGKDLTADELRSTRAPMFFVHGDADGIRLEHVAEMFRSKGGGTHGDLGPRSASRLAILPDTTHVTLMQRVDLLVPMVNDFLDARP